MSRRTEPLTEKLERLTDKSGSCWLWRGHLDKDGYGEVNHGRSKKLKAHRIAWELAHGPIAPGLGVLHRCDNPRCLNPKHLFLGTQANNYRDAMRKGRNFVPPSQVHNGERNPNCKISDAMCDEIRALSGIPQHVIAKRYGIGQSQVSRIRTGIGRRILEAAKEDGIRG